MKLVKHALDAGLNFFDTAIGLPERHYTPRYDFQGISDDRELRRIMARIPQSRRDRTSAERTRSPVPSAEVPATPAPLA